MPRPGEKLGPRKQNLTSFGEWIEMYCVIFHTNQSALAERIGVHQATLSEITRGKQFARIETVRKLWSAICALAEEQEFKLAPYMEELFLNAAGYVSESQRLASEAGLRQFRHRMIQFEQIAKLEAELKEKEAYIARVEAAMRKEASLPKTWKQKAPDLCHQTRSNES